MVDGLPPPYSEIATAANPSDSQVAQIGQRDASFPTKMIDSSNFPRIEGLGDISLETCSHRHEVLISFIVETPEGTQNETNSTPNPFHPTLTFLHHWPHSLILSSTYIPFGRVDAEDLRMIQGFRDLGTFAFPSIPSVQDHRDVAGASVHEYLTHLIPNDGYGTTLRRQQESIVDGRVRSENYIARLIEYLQRNKSSSPEHLLNEPSLMQVRMFTISVFTNSANYLFQNGSTPVWKWAKPQTVYEAKSGFWEFEPTYVIIDGKRRAGKELMLLMRGIQDKERDKLPGGKVLHF